MLITTEISTETTTTPNPSSSTERTVEPEPARGGDQDEQIEDQDGNHGEPVQAMDEEKMVFQEVTPSAPTTDCRSNMATEDQKTVFQD